MDRVLCDRSEGSAELGGSIGGLSGAQRIDRRAQREGGRTARSRSLRAAVSRAPVGGEDCVPCATGPIGGLSGARWIDRRTQGSSVDRS
eukprot:2091937-Pyramimonas_sp.AAC.1